MQDSASTNVEMDASKVKSLPSTINNNQDNSRKRLAGEALGVSIHGQDISPRSLMVDYAGQSGQEPGRKRTRLDSLEHLTPPSDDLLPALSQSRKVHGLTASVWGKIFSHVPPVFLGRLLRVCRDFKAILEPPRTQNITDTLWSLSDAQSVWSASHRRFAPGLPRPMQSQTELEMWRLIRGNSCQICQNDSSLLMVGTGLDPWHADNKTDGVRIIWPLSTRCCHRCLPTLIEQEKSLLFSSFPSFVLPALPSFFLSQNTHYVLSSVLRDSAPPTNVQITKAFSKSKVVEVQEQFEDIRERSEKTVDEWISSLKASTEKALDTIIAWEQWELRGGLKKVNARKKNGTAVKHKSKSKQPPQLRAISSHTENQNHMIPNLSPLASAGTATTTFSPFTPSPLYSPHYQLPGSPVAQESRAPYHAPASRPFRDLREVNEAKAARKTDIERRAMLLDPPILPVVLVHMDSFQAALQIPTPLSDQAWDLLKPRLIAQREEARQRETESQVKAARFSSVSDERLESVNQSAESKDALDEASVALQAPIKDRLSRYADEIIRTKWDDGKDVTFESCAKFAAEVLSHVRRRFYEENHPETSSIQKPDQEINATNDNYVLVLDNMKWVFDNKVRPFTEPLRKEVFQCNGCDGVPKLYGFEAVIQHYAAKHTSSFSQGNVVVHWRAKWPEIPPFHPNPDDAISNSGIMASASNTVSNLQSSTTHSSSSDLYNHSLGGVPAHGHITFADTTQSPAAFQYDHPPAAFHHSAGNYGINHIPQAHPGYAQIAPPAVVAIGNVSTFPAATTVNPLYSYPSTAFGAQSSPDGYYQPLSNMQHYQAQMTEMAKHARDIWFSLSSIKELPANVRIHVVIHHVASRFAQTYGSDPGVAMFLDGLNQNSQMRPVRSLNGLLCKTCAAVVRGGDDRIGPQLLENRKLYTLPILLNHFKNTHVHPQPVPVAAGMANTSSMDWKADMVELPDASQILDLVRLPGMDDHKLSLLAETLPQIFPLPVPKLANLRITQIASQENPGGSRTSIFRPTQNTELDAKNDLSEQNSSHHSILATSSASNLQTNSLNLQVYEPAGEDEYDPHRPAFLGRIIEAKQIPPSIRHSSGHPSGASLENISVANERRTTDLTGSRHHSQSDARGDGLAKRHTATSEADRFLDDLRPALHQSQLLHNSARDNHRVNDHMLHPYHDTDGASQKGTNLLEVGSVDYTRDNSHRPTSGAYHRASTVSSGRAQEIQYIDTRRDTHETALQYRQARPERIQYADVSQMEISQKDHESSGRGSQLLYHDHDTHISGPRFVREIGDGQWMYETVEKHSQPRTLAPSECTPVIYVDPDGREISHRYGASYALPSPPVYAEEVPGRYSRRYVTSFTRQAETLTGDPAASRNRRVEYIQLPENIPGDHCYIYTDNNHATTRAGSRVSHNYDVPEHYERVDSYHSSKPVMTEAEKWTGPSDETKYRHVR